MKLPPERILYTDVNGGQILGYNEEDMRNAMRLHRMPPGVKLSKRQQQTLNAMVTHGNIAAAAAELGVDENSVKKALQLIRQKVSAPNTLLLCIWYVTGTLSRRSESEFQP